MKFTIICGIQNIARHLGNLMHFLRQGIKLKAEKCKSRAADDERNEPREEASRELKAAPSRGSLRGQGRRLVSVEEIVSVAQGSPHDSEQECNGSLLMFPHQKGRDPPSH